jgi:hypothetical protein
MLTLMALAFVFPDSRAWADDGFWPCEPRAEQRLQAFRMPAAPHSTKRLAESGNEPRPTALNDTEAFRTMGQLEPGGSDVRGAAEHICGSRSRFADPTRL